MKESRNLCVFVIEPTTMPTTTVTTVSVYGGMHPDDGIISTGTGMSEQKPPKVHLRWMQNLKSTRNLSLNARGHDSESGAYTGICPQNERSAIPQSFALVLL